MTDSPNDIIIDACSRIIDSIRESKQKLTAGNCLDLSNIFFKELDGQRIRAIDIDAGR